MSAFIPPLSWCGVEHPHNPHRFARPQGLVGAWFDCPGSTGHACCSPIHQVATRDELDFDQLEEFDLPSGGSGE